MNKTRQEIEFANYCQKTYSTISVLLPKPQLGSYIMHDMLKRTDHSLYYLQAIDKYTAHIAGSIKEKDDCLIVEKLALSFSRPEYTKSYFGLQEESISQNCSNSTEGDDLPQKDKKPEKGFKPLQMYKWTTGDETFDLKINDNAFDKAIGKRTLSSLTINEACAMKDKIEPIAKTHAISDDIRKEFWRAKIGNRLRITKCLYDSLVDRLTSEPISRKAEKTITDDLDRTFPICTDIQEGRQMYQNMKLVLSLFEVGSSLTSCIDLTLATCKV